MKKRVRDQLDELRECLNIEREILELAEIDTDTAKMDECRANIAAFEAEIARLTNLREVSDAE